MEVVVQDASTLLNLLKSGLLETAIEGLDLHILTTDLVAAEIKTQRSLFNQAITKGWIEVKTFSTMELMNLAIELQKAKALSIQDVSAVALARSVGCPLFSSDGPVRNYAAKCNLTVRGELWILDQLVDNKEAMKPLEAVQILKTMIEHKARLPTNEVQERIAKWTARYHLSTRTSTG